MEPLHRLTDAVVGVSECLQRPRGGHPDLVDQLGPELLLNDPFQAAICVVYEDNLTGFQEPLGQTQRPDDVVGDHATGIADYVGLAVTEAQ